MTVPRSILVLVLAAALAPWSALAARAAAPARHLQIVVGLEGDAARVASLRLLPGEQQRMRGGRPADDLVFSLEARTGERLATTTAADPTRLRAEYSPDGRALVGQEVRLPAGEVALSFPYDPRAVRLRVSRVLRDGETSGRAKDALWGVALRDLGVLDLGTLPSPGEYEKLAAFETRTVLDNGPSSNRLDVVFLGDGYRASDLAKYHQDVKNVVDYMLDVKPYSDFRSTLNVHVVDVISAEAGIDDPVFDVRRDTALDLSFNIGGTQRCVYTTSPAKVYAAAASVPAYDYIFVVANDDQYGGCGGNFACFTTHEDAVEIAVHEFGHSFGLLADEYGTGDGTGTAPRSEPIPVNATIAKTRQSLAASGKWDYWIPDGQQIPTPYGAPGVGLFEGAVYTDRGAYRPESECRMRALYFDFCRVCTEQHILRLHAFADPIDAFGPAPEDVIGGGRPLAAATDPSGDATGAADVTAVRIVQYANAVAFGIDTAAPLPTPLSGATAYRIALATPGRPLRYVRIGLDRQAALTDENFDEIASLGGAYAHGNTVEAYVPLELLAYPPTLTWSVTTSVSFSTDSVAGSSVTLVDPRSVVLPVASGERVTLSAASLSSPGATYATRWTVDGVAKGTGMSFTVDGAEIGPGRHVVAFELAGSASPVRRDLDGLLSSRRELAVVVGGTAGRPTANAGADVGVGKGAAVTLDGGASEGADLVYTWRQVAGPYVALDDANAPSPALTAPSRDAVLAFQLVVASGDVLGIPDLVYVSVGSVPVVTGASVKKERKLVVAGSNFAAGSVIEVDGVAVADTKASRGKPTARLSSRSALGSIPTGRTVQITVRSPDGVRSAPRAFTR